MPAAAGSDDDVAGGERVRTASISTTCSGSGDGTDAAVAAAGVLPRPASRARRASSAARSGEKNGPIGLVGSANAGSAGSTAT